MCAETGHKNVEHYPKAGPSVWLIPSNPIFIPKPDNGGTSKGNWGFRRWMGEKRKEKVMAHERIDRERKRICPTDMAR
ncbi:hypothetical protein CEXT_490031 [Caerostris extrusa]|uniref:Uncharacterized protein n=1 Tax=Caerostris extrusa TaxID=172846 RepID=A0AAV4QYW3_CAEEX|nr:hypothetical protein CEXT_490031 [Caerostris extrusa]